MEEKEEEEAKDLPDINLVCEDGQIQHRGNNQNYLFTYLVEFRDGMNKKINDKIDAMETKIESRMDNMNLVMKNMNEENNEIF